MKNVLNFIGNAFKAEKDSENMKKSYRKNDEKPDERSEILNSLKETENKLNNTYTLFNMTDDEDLIEAYIHEINALNSRYSYLLNQFKNIEKVGERL